ncbi:hypothetical protein CCHR01_15990 [Colletotrichum chrysophilum]|uniref:Uncharacterized protein n=1 Tax=Colletotrichum chrysophilum TaxID=1836956 RepID=A0AAD9A585_9PEZI|nr:hypothetical protein CCHR01_15990 [Colletotrichum chrysophilum]
MAVLVSGRPFLCLSLSMTEKQDAPRRRKKKRHL